MLTPEIIELCKQASVEQDLGRLLHFVSEINRLIAVRDQERRKPIALECNPESEEHSQILVPTPDEAVATLD